MPMQPGFGQQPRFLITIQPPGAIFNPPAPISMPNVDGLPPHAVTEMYSFDHDINAFVAIGTGTVSADGLAIVSNPGVGVLKAGWHCGGNPAASGGAQSVDVVINTPVPVQLDINGTASISSTGTPSPGTYSWSSSSPGVAQIVGGADGASVTVEGDRARDCDPDGHVHVRIGRGRHRHRSASKLVFRYRSPIHSHPRSVWAATE